jgi:SAM-dependent methyltransferase
MAPELSRRYVKLCDRADFDDAAFMSMLRDIAPGLPPEEEVQRKLWEFTMLALYLHETGRLGEETSALGVGAGHEAVLFWLANRLGRVVAIDIYGEGDFAGGEAVGSMLEDPAALAPYPYREDRLEVRHMDARDLDFPDASFDVVFSLSSIEHFGGPRDVARAAAEVARVLRPGGCALIATECFLRHHPADAAPVHFALRVASAGRRAPQATLRRRAVDVFTPRELQRRIVGPSGLRLVQPLEARVSPRTLENVTRIDGAGGLEPATGRMWPHLVLRARGAPWTSAFLALEKPA